mmetsp:Transcript_10867/g.16549  ORF Transcript_10867/g.16549 Transcript_10867/m.16549 type:complete len:988 (-) Transcript_10867:52-3015(-)
MSNDIRSDISEENLFRLLSILQLKGVESVDYGPLVCSVASCEHKEMCSKVISIISEKSRERDIDMDGIREYLDPSAGSDLLWHCDVSFGTNCSLYEVTHHGPSSRGNFFFARVFGASRFMVVTLKDLPSSSEPRWNEHHALRRLYEKGIDLGGRNFQFIYGKEHKSKTNTSLKAYFFAVDNNDEAALYTTHRLYPVTVDNAIDTLGCFPIDISPEKLTARLALGFSKTLPCCMIKNNQVSVIPDLVSSRSGIMTDGCGFISVSLARQIPYCVRNGRALHPGVPRPPSFPLPVIVQVRVVCGRGLFKGCLLVTGDPYICPEGCLVMRESMKKAEGPGFCPRPSAAITVDVVCTFELPDITTRKLVGGNNCFANLNKFSCLFLERRGVPAAMFEAVQEEELSRLTYLCSSREVALMVIGRGIMSSGMGRSDHCPSETQGRSDYDDDDDNELRRSEGWRSFEQRIGSASMRDRFVYEKALAFLQAGHDIREPSLQRLLRYIQAMELNRMKRFNIRVCGSCYLPGAPDPTGTLKTGEVYVALKRGASVDLEAGTVVTGKVVVIRPPTLHEDEIRVLTAVKSPIISSFLRGTGGGVIFFSTQGHRSAADEMGGGDFDGDLYMVMFCNNEFVTALRDTPPVTVKEQDNTADYLVDVMTSLSISDTPVQCRRVNSFEWHWQRLESLVTMAQKSLLGRYTNSLLAHVENESQGGDPAVTRSCYNLVLDLLDCAKSGKIITENPDLLNVMMPHYTCTGNCTKKYFRSKSILGRLFDRVNGLVLAEPSISPDPLFNSDGRYVIPRCECDLPCQLHTQNKPGENQGRKFYCCRKPKENQCRTFIWLSNTIHVRDEDLVLDDVLGEHHKLVDEWREHLVAYNAAWRMYYSGESTNSEIISDRLKKLYRKRFDDDALKLSEAFRSQHGMKTCDTYINNYFLIYARQTLASAVYLAVYDQPKGDALSFCWEVCPNELHALKANKVKERNGQSPLELLPRIL